MAKRWREPKAKPGELKAQWGRVDGNVDLCYAHGGNGTERSDMRVINTAFAEQRYFPSAETLGHYRVERSLIDELEARGYDIRTLKFSIQKKTP